ncbi:MAG: hypothetical protein HY043_22415 [Verrucomicrobia bacterium]|nr:hypothetical protein [Verrucomicrobiota bacterium]
MMRLQKYISTMAAMVLANTFALAATVPPPEKLLPADTLGIYVIPDFAKARESFARVAMAQLWRDPEMKAFREKFLEKLKSDLIAPLERELGVKFEDYASLAQGQFTVALTRNGWEGKTNQSPGWLLLLDTKEKSGQLKTNLAELRKKWVDAGKQIKTDKIRDVEFTTLIFNADDLEQTLKRALKSKAKSNGAEEKSNGSTNKIELTFGQSESLLLVGSEAKDFEKVLSRQAGGAVPALAEEAAFESKHAALFRDSISYAWLNLEPVIENLSRAAAVREGRASGPMDMQKMIDALGLRGLKTVSFHVNTPPDGTALNFFLAVPEAARKGIFKMLAFESKDAAPPPFVPVDAVKFSRWRLDGQKAWDALETMLGEVSPQMKGAIKLLTETAGKDKDPKFDFRKNFIGNLGDDFISYRRKPRSADASDLAAPPSITLIASANADQLAVALKAVSSLLPMEPGGAKEREFLGKKIYSFALPTVPGQKDERALSFSPSSGYVAFSADAALLEEFLRSSETKLKSLRETTGLSESAEKVGGLGTGFFAYDNNNETLRLLFDSARQDPDKFAKNILPLSGLPGAPDQSTELKEWFDFSLLPPFEKIAKYFQFTVGAGSVGADGLTYKIFAPTPPELQK